jgi:hypothetical protein
VKGAAGKWLNLYSIVENLSEIIPIKFWLQLIDTLFLYIA